MHDKERRARREQRADDGAEEMVKKTDQEFKIDIHP